MDYTRFPDLLQTTDDRWALIRAIQKDWCLNADASKSRTLERSFSRVEQELGYVLPRALREWHHSPSNLFLTMPAHAEPERGQFNSYVFNCLDKKTEYPDPNDWVSMLIDFQGCCEWAFSRSDIHMDDPPVYVGARYNLRGIACDAPSIPGTRYGPPSWHLVNASISEFALQLLLVRMISMAGRLRPRISCLRRGVYRNGFSLTNESLLKIKDNFPTLGLPDWKTGGFFFHSCRLMGHREGLLLINDSHLSSISHTPKGRDILADHIKQLGGKQV